jgi:hypothetical protein
MALAILLISGGIYVKIRMDAEARIEAKGAKDSLTRTQDAVRAGDSVDVSPDGLRSDDGYRRK